MAIDPSDTTDGRERYRWETKFPRKALNKIWSEAVYLSVIMLICFLSMYATWNGWIVNLLGIPAEQTIIFKKYAYYSISGLLGGVAFDIKYLYRSVARGWWHEDRLIWRLLSPYVAMTVAFIIGTMIDASIMTTKYLSRSASHVSIGFLSGYFADQAVGKMYEIARVVFGKSAAVKDNNGK